MQTNKVQTKRQLYISTIPR